MLSEATGLHVEDGEFARFVVVVVDDDVQVLDDEFAEIKLSPDRFGFHSRLGKVPHSLLVDVALHSIHLDLLQQSPSF